jgi:hypothetical protein
LRRLTGKDARTNDDCTKRRSDEQAATDRHMSTDHGIVFFEVMERRKGIVKPKAAIR